MRRLSPHLLGGDIENMCASHTREAHSLFMCVSMTYLNRYCELMLR